MHTARHISNLWQASCLAYDWKNYAKYLKVYHCQMTRLPEEHQIIYNFFTGGGFSAQISKENPFGRIPVDQTIEETIKKDTPWPNCK